MNDLTERVRYLEQKLRRAQEQIAAVVASATHSDLNGVWGESPDLFWVRRPDPPLLDPNERRFLVAPAMVLLSGQIARPSAPSSLVSTQPWELLSRAELAALGLFPPDRFPHTEGGHLPCPCPEVKLPLGTVERLELVLERLREP